MRSFSIFQCVFLCLALFGAAQARFRQNPIGPIVEPLPVPVPETVVEQPETMVGPPLAFGICDDIELNEDFNPVCPVPAEGAVNNGCICYRDGSCKGAFVDDCTCQRDQQILNYTIGYICADSGPTEANEQEEATWAVGPALAFGICDDLELNEDFNPICPAPGTEVDVNAAKNGCICYRDGSCRGAYVDDCTCQNDTNVLNYTIGYICEDSEPTNVNEQEEATWAVGPALAFGICNELPEDFNPVCTAPATDAVNNGCICYNDGTCQDAYVDECTCQTAVNVANYTIGAAC